MRLRLERCAFCALTILVCASFSAAADLATGVHAYNEAEQARIKGDNVAALKGYAVAYKELAPLAKQGKPDAEAILGKMYLTGRGVPKDPDQAHKLFEEAAAGGNADAQFFLGSIYLLPRKDIKQGLMWMRLSAEQGNKDAQLLLGQSYMQGLKELPRDPVQAEMWLSLAAKGNLPFYKTQLQAAEGQMNAAQIARGKVLAATWKPKHGLRPDQGETLKGKPESIGTK